MANQRTPEDFPQNYFAGGKNIHGGPGPTLVDLLNVVHRSFFDGEILVHQKGAGIELMFRALCPFSGVPLTGNHVVRLSLHRVLDQEPPFPLESCNFGDAFAGRVLEVDDGRVYAMTDDSGVFASVVSPRGDVGEDFLYFCAFTSFDLSPGSVPHFAKMYMVRPVMCEPFQFSP